MCPGEAIVVDDNTDEGVLDRNYLEFLGRFHGKSGGFKQNALGNIFNFVQEKMPYDSSAVEEVAKEHGLQSEKKFHLSSYLNEKAGVCRHQALFAGYLIERLTTDENLGADRLRGKVSVDRNIIPGKGGHAWVRYTNSGGEVYIIDPAQQFVGSLETARAKGGWNYDRPLGTFGRLKQRFVRR